MGVVGGGRVLVVNGEFHLGQPACTSVRHQDGDSHAGVWKDEHGGHRGQGCSLDCGGVS